MFQHINKQLQQCEEGINAVIQMEKKIYDDKIITLPEPKMSTPGNKSLIQLEATLLDMASTRDLCQGVLYICPIKVMDKYIVR